MYLDLIIFKFAQQNNAKKTLSILLQIIHRNVTDTI